MRKVRERKQTLVAVAARIVVVMLFIAVWGSAFAVSPILKEMEDAFIRLGEEVRPCVVNIDAEGTTTSHRSIDMGDVFKFFDLKGPKDAPKRNQMRTKATGSGFIYDKEGHIITNNHVVADTDELTVRLWNGNEYKAKVVGTDPETDLAIIKIDADEDLPIAQLGNSDNIKVGQFAIAIGSPRSFEGSLSFGHISALGRESLRLPGMVFQNFIQTDAAINLGNSGGPLCNLDGEVIGINVAILYGAESIGFAIPVNQLKLVIEPLISEGKVTRGFLGVAVYDASLFADALELPDSKGAFVNEVIKNLPAEDAGILYNDVIRKVNGETVENRNDLISKVSQYLPDTEVNLEVWRDGEPIMIKVLLKARPPLSAQLADTEEDESNVLGVQVAPLTREVSKRMGFDSDIEGVIVSDVELNSAAEDASISVGDVITEVARNKVTDVAEFRDLMKEYAIPGKSILIRVLVPGVRPGSRAIPGSKVIKVPESD